MNTKIWSKELSFGSNFVFCKFLSNKKNTIIFTRSWVLVYITFAHGRTDGRTDKHFSKKLYFFLLIKNIYTCLYLSRLFFIFLAYFLSKLVYLFFHITKLKLYLFRWLGLFSSLVVLFGPHFMSHILCTWHRFKSNFYYLILNLN